MLNFFYLLILLPLFSLVVDASERFKGVDLWLPKAYQDKYTNLLQAADIVKEDPYCHEMLSGRMLEAKSSSTHMYFTFRCRTQEKFTFSIQVDGRSLALTNSYGEEQKKIEEEKRMTEEELNKKETKDIEAIRQSLNREEAAKLAETISQRRREQSQFWQVCRKEIRRTLRNFNEVNIISDSLPVPLIQADQFTYTVLFDSINPSKKTLHFQVNCVISDLDFFDVKVSPRGKILDLSEEKTTKK